MASTNATDVAYVKELTAGVTPDTPVFKRLPVTGAGVSDNLSTAVSEVLRKDRMIDDLVLVDSETGGDVPYELSYGPYKPLLISLLQGGGALASIDLSTLTDIEVVSSTNSYDSTTTDFDAEGFEVGQHVLVSGFAEAENNGVKRVVTVAATQLVVSDTGLVDEAAGASVAFKGSMYRNGAENPDNYTFRKSFDVPGGVESIFYNRGCQVSSMSFNFQTGAILAGTMNLMGLTTEGTTTPIAGETIEEVSEYSILNSVSSITNLELSGLPATAFFQSLDLTVNNNANAQKGIGQLGARAIANFTLEVTADLTLYFEDLSLYNQYKASTPFAVYLTLEDADGNMLVMTLPRCKFSELSEPVNGKDEFLTEEGSLQALRDPDTNCVVQFDFIDA